MPNLRIIFFLLIYVSIAHAQPPNTFQLMDIFNLEYVSDPQVSPDGSRVVYVRNFKDVMSDQNLSNIWIIDYDGGNHYPLTTGNFKDGSPRWSPDGKKLIYVSNRSGRSQIHMLLIDKNINYQLTNLTNSPNAISWSNTGDYLAMRMFVPSKPDPFVALPTKPKGAEWNDPPVFIDDFTYRRDGRGYLKQGFQQLFILPVEGGTPRQLTFGKYDLGAPEWGKNDKYLYFSANMDEKANLNPLNSEIYSLEINSGAIEKLTDRYGPDFSPIISPDGNKIAYLGFDDKFLGYQQSKLYIMDQDGSDSKLVTTDFDRSIDNINWDASGKVLYFQYNEKGETRLAYATLKGKIEEMAAGLGGLSIGRPYNAAAYSVSNNGRYAYTDGDTDHPSDLGVGDSLNNRRLTSLNDDLFSFRQLGAVEEMWYESSYDQQRIQGWIVKPPNFDPSKKYPLILEIHGGPFASYGKVFSAEIQAYASKGYVVLYTNPRGSSGYGADFGNLIHHNYPNQDYFDLISGVDAVIDKGYIDEDNLFVTGGSGGGVLTAWIVGKTDRFKAAVVAKPVINWYSFVLYADGLGFFYKYWFPEKPWENPEAYLKRSPISYVENVTTPTMLLTGEEDYRTPIAESEQFYAALKLNGVETAMVRIPGASHGIADKPSNLVAKISYILGWFEKYRD